MNFEEFDRYAQKEKTADHNQHHDPPCESSPWVLPIWVHREILVQSRRALKGAPYRRPGGTQFGLESVIRLLPLAAQSGFGGH